MALLEETTTPYVALTHSSVDRPINKIQELEPSPSKVNQRELITDAVKDPRSAARGVEGPTMGGTIQTMSVMQIPT